MPQDFSWKGGDGDGWFTASDWSPSGPPTAGSVARIDKSHGGPRVNSGDPVVDNVGITLGVNGADLVANGGSFGAGVTVTSLASSYADLAVLESSGFDGGFRFADGIAGSSFNIDGTSGQTLTIGPNATLSANSRNGIFLYNGTVTNYGTLEAAGGIVSVYSGALDGTGTVAVSNGGEFYSNVDIGDQTVDFLDQTGLLYLNGASTLVGPLVNFQPGDEIILGGINADAVKYDATTHRLDVISGGSVAAHLSLISNGSSLDFHVWSSDPSVITSSDATRIWNGGTADWYGASNWSSTPASPASFPLAGDTVKIGSGLATISAADVLQFGSIDAENIILNGVTGAPAGLLLTDDTIGPHATIQTNGQKQYGVLEIAGTVTVNGDIKSQAKTGQLTIDLIQGGTLITGGGANVISSTPSGLRVDGEGMFVNNGVVVAEGGMVIGHDVTFTSDLSNGDWGTVRLQQGGRLTVDGTFAANGVLFGDATGYLTIDNLAGFQGAIWQMGAGNRIDLAHEVVNSVSYDASADTLTLYNDGTQVGQPLLVETTDGQSGFSVKSDNNGGSLITYKPQVKVLQPAIAAPLVAAPGSSESLQDLLIHAFGTVPANYSAATFGLSYVTTANLSDWNFSYWNLQDEQVSEWYLNGTLQPGLPSNPYMPPNPPTTVVPGSNLTGITLQAGNAIMPGIILTVPTGGTAQGPTASTAYYIPTIDPQVASPTIYSGVVDPQDIIESALRFAQFYGTVTNDNDCGWIADDVAAAAGASMPNLDQSTDPSANVSGGFWRVVYRASDYVDPAQDWSSLVQAGDVVRMGWSGGGQHTTTVLAKNADGSILVYDNDDDGVIGIHDAEYWTDTVPSSITIYRLDPNHQYLVTGGSAAEFLQGSAYSNLIQPGGGADTIAAGVGQNEIQDTAVDLNGVSVIDWHQGDTIDVTDLKPSGATVSYDAQSGVLDISNSAAQQQVLIDLPTGVTGMFQLAPDATGNGTSVTMACFATGTRLRTPDGDIAVEALTVGDRLVTVRDAAVTSREIRWIGRRTIDPRRHPHPDAVRPVRIAAHAFGDNLPERPLLLSPDHAIFFANVLIPVRYLIDGKRIKQVSPATVTYWHVELDVHDIVLAEGLATESYLDTGQRPAFENGGQVVALHADFAARVWEAVGCAELVITGAEIAAARAVLNASVGRGKRARRSG